MSGANRFSLLHRMSMAIILIGLCAIGWMYFTGDAIDVSDERSILIAAIWRHVGHGVIFTPLLLAYLTWRFAGPKTFAEKTAMVSLSRWLLGLALVFLLVTGPLVVWTYGFPLKVFDWFAIPNPIGKAPQLHSLLEPAHVVVAKAAPWLAGADAVIVLYAYRTTSS